MNMQIGTCDRELVILSDHPLLPSQITAPHILTDIETVQPTDSQHIAVQITPVKQFSLFTFILMYKYCLSLFVCTKNQAKLRQAVLNPSVEPLALSPRYSGKNPAGLANSEGRCSTHQSMPS